MTDITLYITFLVLSFWFIAIPGPNIVWIVAVSLDKGRVRGLQTVAGTTTAMAVQLSVAAFGTTVLAVALSESFVWVKWIGVFYLAYLGIRHFHDLFRRDVQAPTRPMSAKGSFTWGFIISLTNPKTILFFGAFLPQFVSPTYPQIPQMVWLSLSFLLLAGVIDSLYALGAAKFTQWVKHPKCRVWRHGTMGTLMLVASLGLALSRRG